MRTTTIRELHMNTGKLARAAAPVGKPFPRRDIGKIPKSKVDLTIYVSQDRDRQ